MNTDPRDGQRLPKASAAMSRACNTDDFRLRKNKFQTTTNKFNRLHYEAILSFLCRDLTYSLYICTKFDQYSFSRSRDVVGVHQSFNGSLDLTTSVISVVVFQFQFQLKFWITSFSVTIKFNLFCYFSFYYS